MDNSKKGIRLKTKEVSLVDNIVSFFKKDPKNQTDRIPSPQNDQKDTSPRSTTPRKKIFNKTPQKAGKINFIKSNNKNSHLINKSISTAHQLTFNDEARSFENLKTKNSYSPSNKVNYVSKPMQDTHFNKLILGASNLSINQKKGRTPERTFLSENQGSQACNQISIKKVKQELDHYKRLSQQLRRQNVQLKKQNRNLAEQIQNLHKKLKSYELSNKNLKCVQIVSLDTPKSPFEKQEVKAVNQSKNRSIMKQSIPILPQTPSQYGHRSQQPKIQQMSIMSSNLKNISHENSFISENSDSALPNFIKKQNSNQQLSENSEILSPFMQKSVYDKTMKPQQKNKRSSKQLEKKEEITFSKTVGYLKGDQPEQQIHQKNNPFLEMATQSNKFIFQSNNQSQSNNSFKVVPPSKSFPTREWLNFNQSENSQQISHQTSHYQNSNAFKKENPFTRVGNPLEKSSQMQKNREKFQRSQNLLKSLSPSKSQKVDQSRTYKFEDFDVNDQGSSYVDFF